MAEIRERELQRRRVRDGEHCTDDAADSGAGYAPCSAPGSAPDASLAQPAAWVLPPPGPLLPRPPGRVSAMRPRPLPR
eukprot:9665193-Alexandrium_andersonii.AAC.1